MSSLPESVVNHPSPSLSVTGADYATKRGLSYGPDSYCDYEKSWTNPSTLVYLDLLCLVSSPVFDP